MRKLSFAVVGGDARQARLAELFEREGHTVRAYVLDKYVFAGRTIHSDDLGQLCEPCDCVVLPLPVQGEPGMLLSPLSGICISLRRVFELLPEGQLAAAGKIGPAVYRMAEEHGIYLEDYLEREEFSVSNAVATAEGAIQIAMEELPITLHGSKCLVVGYGRIGKLLSSCLKAFGAHVTASARKHSDIAWIRAYGCEALHTNRLDGMLRDFDVVFNTVPHEVLGAPLLEELKEGCLCVDLASKPGGIDFENAKKLGIKTIWALSLPGKVAPVTAGNILKETIINIIENREGQK